MMCNAISSPFSSPTIYYQPRAPHLQVVRRVLSTQREGFELTTAMPWWERRGHVLTDGDQTQAAQIARSVVRSSYPEDGTIGFFLAKFVRGSEPEPEGEFRMKLQALAQARASKGGRHAAKKHAGKKRAHDQEEASAAAGPAVEAQRREGDGRPEKKARGGGTAKDSAGP